MEIRVDNQGETGETDRLTNNDTQAEAEASVWMSCWKTCCDWRLEILSCSALPVIFIFMWIYLPTLTSDYKQANEHFNGTVSHSPNYVGFGERQSLVCNTSMTIGTVLPTEMIILPFFRL